MKKFTIFIALSFMFACMQLNAQITPGLYFNTGPDAEVFCVRFVAGGEFMMRIGNDTVGGTYEKPGEKYIKCRYILDNTVTPHKVDVLFYDAKTSVVMKKVLGIYRRTGTYDIDLAMSVTDKRPVNFKAPYPEVLHLTLNTSENYIHMLQLYEAHKIGGFVPATYDVKKDSGVVQRVYIFNNQPLNSTEFQSREVLVYNDHKKLISRSLYDVIGKAYVNKLGYFKERNTYDVNDSLIVKEFLKNDNDLMVYKGDIFPRTTYTYTDGKLVRKECLINSDALKLSKPVRTEYIFDSYGDNAGTEEYFADGKMKQDSLRTLVIKRLEAWIATNSNYPSTFRPVLYGVMNHGAEVRDGLKIDGSHVYEIYAEFFLNDSTNAIRKFTGFFQMNSKFEVTAVSFKSDKTNSPVNAVWVQGAYEAWIRQYGKR